MAVQSGEGLARHRRVDAPSGPIFIVGMPRSGTKLLREILGGHDRMRFADVETEFFPFWVANWPQLMPAGDPHCFARFYRQCMKLPFFMQLSERGEQIEEEDWRSRCSGCSPAQVFDGLMRTYLDIGPSDQGVVWGDKSPTYVRHIPLLIQHFPSAMVIHIIRDVRDYALSMRAAWRKSILRSAQRWADDVSKARADGLSCGARYVELRYEDLLHDPDRTTQSLCGALGVSYEAKMLNIDRTFENLGAAREVKGLVSGNRGKYASEMHRDLQRKVEEIAGDTLHELGYPTDGHGRRRRLSGWKLRWLQVYDAVGLLSTGIQRHGLRRTVSFHLSQWSTSGNRI